MENLQEKRETLDPVEGKEYTMTLKRICFEAIPDEAQNKKETRVQAISSDFCKISKNIFFTEHLLATASEMWKA